MFLESMTVEQARLSYPDMATYEEVEGGVMCFSTWTGYYHWIGQI